MESAITVSLNDMWASDAVPAGKVSYEPLDWDMLVMEAFRGHIPDAVLLSPYSILRSTQGHMFPAAAFDVVALRGFPHDLAIYVPGHVDRSSRFRRVFGRLGHVVG